MEGRTQTISVGVIEDDAMVRAWVRLALEGSEFRLAGEAGTVAEGVALVERRRPSLLLVDYHLPDGTATELVRELRARGSTAPALVITAAPRVGLNELAREAGAQGVVLKQSEPADLLGALRRIAAGESVVEPGHPRRPPGRSPLSPRERAVLDLVATGSSNHEIAAALGIGAESVKTLLRRAFVKLDVDNRIAAVEAARAQGLL